MKTIVNQSFNSNTMKKVFQITLMAAAAILLLAACTKSLATRFDDFVNDVEKNCASYSEDDWNKANEQFEKMVKEFDNNKSSYTEEEQKQIRDAIAKYYALVTKSGISSVVDSINEFFEQFPSFIEDLGTFFKELFKSPSGE